MTNIVDVLKVSGNYQIYTKTGGDIRLDVGGAANTGTVTINGNLVVLGAQTVITSTNVTISDNILILNAGEPGPDPLTTSTTSGITLKPDGSKSSGIMISRGHSDDPRTSVFFRYDDDFDYVDQYGVGAIKGIWRFGGFPIGSTFNSNVGRVIETGGIFIPQIINTLTILGSYNPTAVISVQGTTNYEDRVTKDYHIPNKKYVDSLLGTTNIANRLQVGNTAVTINDNSISTGSQYYNIANRVTVTLGTTTNVVFRLQDVVAQFKGLQIVNNQIQITNTGTDTSIILSPSTQGILQVDSGIKFKKSTPVTATAGYTGIYSTSTVGGGGTGLYFVNTAKTDELVSRRRSIIYGLIF